MSARQRQLTCAPAPTFSLTIWSLEHCPRRRRQRSRSLLAGSPSASGGPRCPHGSWGPAPAPGGNTGTASLPAAGGDRAGRAGEGDRWRNVREQTQFNRPRGASARRGQQAGRVPPPDSPRRGPGRSSARLQPCEMVAASTKNETRSRGSGLAGEELACLPQRGILPRSPGATRGGQQGRE